MFNKNDWLFASPAIPAGCTGVCFTDLLGAHNATKFFSTCADMGAELRIRVIREPDTEAGVGILVYVTDHRT